MWTDYSSRTREERRRRLDRGKEVRNLYTIYTCSDLLTDNLVFAAFTFLQDSGSSPRSRSFWQRRHQRLLSEGALVSTLGFVRNASKAHLWNYQSKLLWLKSIWFDIISLFAVAPFHYFICCTLQILICTRASTGSLFPLVPLCSTSSDWWTGFSR